MMIKFRKPLTSKSKLVTFRNPKHEKDLSILGKMFVTKVSDLVKELEAEAGQLDDYDDLSSSSASEEEENSTSVSSVLENGDNLFVLSALEEKKFIDPFAASLGEEEENNSNTEAILGSQERTNDDNLDNPKAIIGNNGGMEEN